jgi:uncharacterized membrane protein
VQATEVKIGEWISKGFDLYKDNLGLLIVAGLLVGVLSAVTVGILAGPLLAGLTMMVLALLDKKEPQPQAGDVFKGFSVFLNAFLFVIVYLVVLAVGSLVLNLLPCVGQLLGLAYNLLLGALVMFSIFLIADRQMAFWPAVTESVNMVKTNFWPFLALYVVASVIGALGIIACGIGVLATFPITVCILAVAFREAGAAGTPTETPAA